MINTINYIFIFIFDTACCVSLTTVRGCKLVTSATDVPHLEIVLT
jgi:hypothetical protein